MKPSIIEFVTDPQLLGLSLSPAQETLLRAIYGLPPASEEQRDLFRACTGREVWPASPFAEVTVVAGGRSGKDSRIAAPVLLYEALFGDHEAHLHRGERGVIPLVAQDQRGTRVAFGYVRDYLMRSPLLASTVDELLASEITLINGLAVYCFPCTQRSLRGWSIPAAVMDELAFYRLEGQADSDVEVQASIRRGMVNFPAPRLVKVSTPYMRGGLLFEDFRRAFGQPDPDLLVWRAPTRLMNPTIPEARLERERRLDPHRFAREFEAEFSEDLDAYLPAVLVEHAVVPGRHVLPPQEGVQYVAAVDPSGGGADAFTLAITHLEGTGADVRVVQDVMRGWSRVGAALDAVVAEIASIVKTYRLREVIGDRYGAGWVRERFARHGIAYREAPKDKSAIYSETLPLFTTGRIDLLDDPHLVRELKTLERRPRAGGRALIDHPHGGHDDFANATCLAAYAALCTRLDVLAGEVTVWVPGLDRGEYLGGATHRVPSTAIV